MIDIFVSYSRVDREFVAALVDALQAQGWSVWWDREVDVGDRWNEEIERALRASQCTLVVWSEHATQSSWVRAEASESLNRGVLIPVRIDTAMLPLPFTTIETSDLSGWDGSESDEFQRVCARIAEVLGGSTDTRWAELPSQDPSLSTRIARRVISQINHGDALPLLNDAISDLALLHISNPEETRGALVTFAERIKPALNASVVLVRNDHEIACVADSAADADAAASRLADATADAFGLGWAECINANGSVRLVIAGSDSPPDQRLIDRLRKLEPLLNQL